MVNSQSHPSHSILLLHLSLFLPVVHCVCSPGAQRQASFGEVKLMNSDQWSKLSALLYLKLANTPFLKDAAQIPWWVQACANSQEMDGGPRCEVSDIHFPCWSNINRRKVHIFFNSVEKIHTVKVGSVRKIKCTLTCACVPEARPCDVCAVYVVSVGVERPLCLDSSLNKKGMKELLPHHCWSSESCNLYFHMALIMILWHLLFPSSSEVCYKRDRCPLFLHIVVNNKVNSNERRLIGDNNCIFFIQRELFIK